MAGQRSEKKRTTRNTVEAVGLPQDGLGFVRRECPRCRRQFKTRQGAEDQEAVTRVLLRHLPHQNPHETSAAQSRLYCAYCGATASAERFLTPHHVSLLRRRARTLQTEIQHEQMMHVLRTLSDNPYPTFFAVRPKRSRPLNAVEPDDMRRTGLMCCGDEIKLEPHWTEPFFCPRCGVQHQSGLRRVRLELDEAEA